MNRQRQKLLEILLATVRAMPEAELREVADFADFLQAKHGSSRPERGSADGLLRHAGSLRFEPGEMDQILADVAEMRHMDLERDA